MPPAGRRSVVDIALQGEAHDFGRVTGRLKALDRLRFGDLIFRHLTRSAAIAVLVILGGAILSLISGSLPAHTL